MELLFGALIATISFFLGVVFKPYITKKIEAEISSGVWNKQKRWELKRDVLFETTRKMYALDDAMTSYSSILSAERRRQKEREAQTQTPSMDEQAAWKQAKGRRLKHWNKASSEFDLGCAFVRIVCGKETAAAFTELGLWVHKFSAQLAENPDAERGELTDRILLVQKAIRKELEVDA